MKTKLLTDFQIHISLIFSGYFFAALIYMPDNFSGSQAFLEAATRGVL